MVLELAILNSKTNQQDQNRSVILLFNLRMIYEKDVINKK